MNKNLKWVGPEWGQWNKVQIVFRALGFDPPKSYTEGEEGAFVLNIVQQYQADLSPYEVRGIIDFATRSNPDRITDIQKRGTILELDDVLAGYSED